MGAQWYKWANSLVQNIFESTGIWHISTDAINDVVQPLHYNRMKLSTCYLIPDLMMMMMTRFLSFFLSELPAEEGELFWGRLSFPFFPLIITNPNPCNFLTSLSSLHYISSHREVTLGAGPGTVWGLTGSDPAASCLHILCKQVHLWGQHI